MNIDEHTLALVGYPIDHSLSPSFQNEAIQLLNLDYHYQSISIKPTTFLTEFPSLLSKKIAGMNITMPYKKAVIPFLDHLSDLSILTGSVNTIYRLGNCYYGTSTDGIGFFKSLFYKFPFFNPNIITILGCGGAARSILAASTAYPIKEIYIFQRKGKHWDECFAFVESLKLQFPTTTTIHLLPWSDETSLEKAIKISTLLINCTNIGFDDSNSPLSNPHFLHPGLHVYDIIYKDRQNDPETTFIKQSRLAGCTVQTGIGMLLFQGAESFQLFTKKEMPIHQLKTLNPHQL